MDETGAQQRRGRRGYPSDALQFADPHESALPKWRNKMSETGVRWVGRESSRAPIRETISARPIALPGRKG